jgi:lysophospholipase L1-like esterase
MTKTILCYGDSNTWGCPPRRHFEREANAHGCAFLDAGKVIRSSDIDGIHLEVDAQQTLGHAVAQAIKRLPGWPAG